MSYNGSGTFQINTSGQPVVAGTVISSTAFNALTADLATGLSTAITKDGQTTTTVRIPFAAGISSTLVTDSSSTSTGSIITAGGVGIAKALYVGTTANIAGTTNLAGLTASSAVATDASKNLVSVTNTGTGNNVLATAPTIASLNLTTALTLASASGTVGQVLTSGGSGNAPTWSSSNATSIVNGTSNVTVNSSGGTISAATAGTTALTVDTSQLVGIGTTTPNSFGGGLVVRKSNTAQGVTNATAQFSDATNSALWVGHTSGASNIVSDAALTFGYTNGTTTTENARISTAGVFSFNSGYGSVATAYGCRAWVNFNGTGTVAIRASGNVSSITDNGTGDYTVNFTTALVDANYAVEATGNTNVSTGGANFFNAPAYSAPSTTAVRVATFNQAGTNTDMQRVNVAVFR